MLRFTALFVLTLCVLFVLELLQPVDRAVLLPFTHGLASVSAAVINLFSADVQTMGKIILMSDGSFGISIERGCNGIEAVILLTAYIIAFPSTLRSKAIGILVGASAIEALNVVRVVSLFFLGVWNRHWFEWAHLYLWQALIVLDAMVLILVWTRWASRRTPTTAVAVTAA